MRFTQPSRRFWRLGITLLATSAAACGSDTTCSDQPGTACTWAGVVGSRGFNGDGQPIRQSWLYFPEDLTFAPDGRAWVVDWNNHRVRRVEANGTFATVIGTDYEGDGPPGEIDRLPEGAPQGCAPNAVALNHPTDIKFMPDGTAVLAAWHNNKIRVISPTTGLLTVLAGNSYGFGGDDGPAYMAVFNQPKSIAIDAQGQIYTNDQRNERIRVIGTDAARTIRTIAGTGTKGSVGDGGPALQAEFGWDLGVTPHPSGALALRGHELFLADTDNNRIRKIDLDTGTISCVAGDGCPIQATFNYPMDLEFGPDGRLYVADRFAYAIEAVDLVAGTVTRVAGNGKPCDLENTNCVEAKEGLPALEIQLNQPYGLTFDPQGNMYIADTHNSRIVRIARGF